jgi:N-acetylglutamate synthase-like GNAT family acetyltransferase
MQITIAMATASHIQYAEDICNMMSDAAQIRGTGIAKRNPAYISQKMADSKAVIALDSNQVVGFCYIESWDNQKYVANSGLIVHPDYRNTGLAKAIKKKIFLLSKQHFPDAKLFGITTSMTVMKINSDLGYQPVTFSALTQDETFWKGCSSCPNYDILQRTKQSMCLCTAMVCDLKTVSVKNLIEKPEGWEKFKRFLKYRKIRLQRKSKEFPKLK